VWQPSPQLAYRSAVLNAYNILSAPELKYTLAFIAVAVICILTFREDRTLKPDEVREVLKKHPGWDERLLSALKEGRERVGK
ncbi:MAG: hypothetical protein QXV74_05655, partial [Candidatus Bathyarchaeia archaeon]